MISLAITAEGNQVQKNVYWINCSKCDDDSPDDYRSIQKMRQNPKREHADFDFRSDTFELCSMHFTNLLLYSRFMIDDLLRVSDDPILHNFVNKSCVPGDDRQLVEASGENKKHP